MEAIKKVIFVGPPNSGKTTIKKIYFEKLNPLDLLQFGLDPTKGINSSIYSFFNLKIGIFDLAGQENENWFTIDKEIFFGGNIIICIFDISSTIDIMVRLLTELLRLKKELNLIDCKIVIFLHKIDLVSESYPSIAIKFIKKSLEKQGFDIQEVKIYTTSIAKDFFLETYYAILDVLNHIFKVNLIKKNSMEINNLKTELLIILECKSSFKYYISDIAKHFNLNTNQIKFHLDRLERLGFIQFSFMDPFSFKLTNHASWIKLGLKKERIEKDNKDKVIKLMHSFINIKELSAEV